MRLVACRRRDTESVRRSVIDVRLYERLRRRHVTDWVAWNGDGDWRHWDAAATDRTGAAADRHGTGERLLWNDVAERSGVNIRVESSVGARLRQWELGGGLPSDVVVVAWRDDSVSVRLIHSGGGLLLKLWWWWHTGCTLSGRRRPDDRHCIHSLFTTRLHAVCRMAVKPEADNWRTATNTH